MKFVFLKAVILLSVMIISNHNNLSAQSIGFDLGIAGTQNYGEPNAAFGLSIIMPFNENLEAVFSYHQWRGEDDNYTLAKEHNKAGNTHFYGTFFGNKELFLFVNYKYFSTGRLSLLCGGGLSQFEMLDWQGTLEAQSKYYGAVTIVPLYVKYRITERMSIYTRGSLSANVTEFIPDWGLLNIGIEEKLF